ncbi:hypothetical protein BH23THE1_BH23THE1_00130 [soil metagenome]
MYFLMRDVLCNTQIDNEPLIRSPLDSINLPFQGEEFDGIVLQSFNRPRGYRQTSLDVWKIDNLSSSKRSDFNFH